MSQETLDTTTNTESAAVDSGSSTGVSPATASSANGASSSSEDKTKSSDSAVVVPGAQAGSALVGGQDANPYTPNFKYKVKDKELEMAEWVRTAVKNKAHEDELRDLYTKSVGIDEIKQERDSIKANFTKLEPEYKQLTQSLDVLSGYVQQGDFGKFFKSLRIPEKAFLEYAVERLQYHNLPQEERARLDARVQEQERFQQLGQQNSAYEEALQRQAEQTRALEYNFAVSKPEVSSFVQAYDAAVGTPGAFRQKVVEKGLLAAQYQGIDIGAEDAIQAVMKEFAGFIKPSVGAGQLPQNTPMASQLGANNKPVIPNLSSSAGTGSPIKRTFKNLAEIRAASNKS